jgi:hypothetical protein
VAADPKEEPGHRGNGNWQPRSAFSEDCRHERKARQEVRNCLKLSRPFHLNRSLGREFGQIKYTQKIAMASEQAGRQQDRSPP